MSGQLGQDTSTVTISTIPEQAKTDAALGKITSITAGGSHTCVLLTNGQAQCWGNNTYGQLGNGTTNSSFKAITVMSDSTTVLSNVLQISAGYQTTCAVVTDPTYTTIAKCWGYGDDGELGNGRSGTDYTEKYPVSVITSTSALKPLADVQSVSVGYDHVCAIAGAAKTIYCWGYNNYGQLGNGSTTNSNLPTAVLDSGGSQVSADTVSAMDNTSCALRNAGVQCWGVNGYGQLGAGLTNDSSALPVDVKLKAAASSLSANGFNACVVDKNGAIECWGDSSYGTIGLDPYASSCNNSSYACSNVPIIVGFPNASANTQIAQIAVGSWFLNVLDAKGSIFSIGYNGSGDLGTGDGSVDYSFKPLEIYYAWRL